MPTEIHKICWKWNGLKAVGMEKIWVGDENSIAHCNIGELKGCPKEGYSAWRERLRKATSTNRNMCGHEGQTANECIRHMGRFVTSLRVRI